MSATTTPPVTPSRGEQTAGTPPSPRAYESDAYGWNLSRIPDTITIGNEQLPHPARTCAIFVVHGMGEQHWTDTAARLRAGFEDALDAIETWQRQKGHELRRPDPLHRMPPPFVCDGYWGDYTNLEATFPEDWQRFNERERQFFSGLWQRRTLSLLPTVGWLIAQQFRILHPRVRHDVGWSQYILYWPLQVLWFGAFLYFAIRRPRTITNVIADVRLYVNPRGIAERAIVQRIDERVGRMFLQLIGLDWNFRALPSLGRVQAGGERVSFERVVWVAHSLGSVISYNVLSDLFHRAAELERHGDSEQQLGVKVFRRSLMRFVTIGSPLNKVAYLFAPAIRPWPDVPRSRLLDHGDEYERDGVTTREWWSNFYHALDPVSAPLGHRLICRRSPPANFHIDWHQLTALIPGVAHIAYWSDTGTLRFILGRLFSRRVLPDQKFEPKPPRLLKVYALLGYVVWAAIIVGGMWGVVELTPRILPWLWRLIVGQA